MLTECTASSSLHAGSDRGSLSSANRYHRPMAKRNPEVDAWFAASEHPMKDTMMRVRDMVLAADSRMAECIKWKTPTFTYKGNLASFNPNTKRHVSLMFHTGAKIPGRFSRLEGTGNTARYLKITGPDDAKKLKPELEKIVAAWCASKESTPSRKKSAKKKATKKKSAAKKPAAKKPAAKKPAAKKPAKKKSAKKKPAAKKKPTAKKKKSKRRAARR